MKPPAETTQFSEEFLRRVVASSPDCIKILDLDGNLLAMNEGGQKVLEIVDVTPHLGTCWTGWWEGSTSYEDARRAVEKAQQGSTGRFEAFANTFGGTPKWWDVTVSPILGADGKPEKLLSVSRDITEGKLAAIQVAESERQLRLLSEQRRLALDSAQMGWWHVDLVTGELHMDKRFRAIFDVDEQNGSYEHVLQRIHPEDRSRVDAAVQAAVRPVDPVPYAVEYRVVHRDGSLHWVAAKGQTAYHGEDSGRRAVGFAGTMADITHEKAAHEALRESEAKYRSIFTSIDQGYCVIKVIFNDAGQPTDYLFLEINPAFEQQTGLKNAAGKRMRELAPEHEEDWFKIYGHVATTGLPTRFEAEAAALGRWYDVHASRLDHGDERRVAIVFTDITERRANEEALRIREASSRFLADLGETTRQTTDPDAVLGVVVDALRAHLQADRCAYVEVEEDQDAITIRYDRVDPTGDTRSLAGQYRLHDFGQQMAPMLRSGQTVVITDFSADAQFADAKDGMATVGVASLVNVPLVKAGRLVAVLAVNAARPRRWKADEVALIEAVAERSWGEVERSRVAQALAFERHQLQLIFRESPAAMTVWRGEDLVFERVNPEYQDIFRGRQLVGRPLLEACPELAGQGFDDLLREVLHTGRPFVGREVLAKIQKDKDGPIEDHYFDFSYLQITDPAGRPWGVYDHAVDVTDRVVARLAVEQAQRDLRQALADRQQLLEAEQAARAEAERVGRLKDEFLATLSHELRTPLNAILGWAQVLRGDPANVEDVEAGLATIERNAKAQTQIIEDLLDMSKIISGKVRLDVQSLHLDQVVTAAVDTMRPAAAAKGIRLQALIDPQASMISGDPNRLQQVFWNLLTNAIKFTPKEGKVQMVLERFNSLLEVSVGDTGEGIAPEFLPYVFDRFRQQDATTTRRHGGLGLGLAIVKQLVELHGGSINVASQGVGHGTTFCVKLPLSAVQPARVEADPERRHPQSEADLAAAVPAELLNLAGIKVLVVDDELDARLLVKRLLEDRQATVHDAGSVREALTLFHAERPDVLVSDIGMPGEDGYSLIHKVRALKAEEGGRTPALALTAYARAEDRLKAVLAGFELHLSKPVSAVELLAFVVKLAGRVGGS